jgi:hypothetical protein
MRFAKQKETLNIFGVFQTGMLLGIITLVRDGFKISNYNLSLSASNFSASY